MRSIYCVYLVFTNFILLKLTTKLLDRNTQKKSNKLNQMIKSKQLSAKLQNKINIKII